MYHARDRVDTRALAAGVGVLSSSRSCLPPPCGNVCRTAFGKDMIPSRILSETAPGSIHALRPS